MGECDLGKNVNIWENMIMKKWEYELCNNVTIKMWIRENINMLDNVNLRK